MDRERNAQTISVDREAAMSASDPELIRASLAEYCGTEQYYRSLNFVYTDGVKAMAELCGAYWLIDLIASWQVEKRVRTKPFQVWELTVQDDRGSLTMREDGGEPILAHQHIEYTDFPLGEIKFYVASGVLMLPSEY